MRTPVFKTVGLVGVLWACSPRTSEVAAEAVPQPRAGVVLQVQNNSTMDVRVFVERGRVSSRLGLVTGMSSAQFEIAPDLVGPEIRFFASLVGGRNRARTDGLTLRPGQVVSWRLDNMLRAHHLAVY